ncbi:autoinducer binding domain-containing protein [Shimia sp. R10_1]|uniref:helix-turn-helix transcriptional regulator n=1 Tax=Shimia sp. R10_1 TaxID=2821095 RepID=UPI001ADBDB33|nr:LuxR C-terminal-related transcriptional regulator [Shimia sp. R10_1]MBO9472249.1 autoinducer binding domain-containing protein [Shimia sp. R10_1]
MKNAIIDVVDRFVGVASNQRTWELAEASASDCGFDHLLVAKVSTATRDIDWVNTNMPDCWMQEYLVEDYISSDPIISLLESHVGSLLYHAGMMRADEITDQKAYAVSHGLRQHGMSHLHCSRFESHKNNSVFVTLCSENEAHSILKSPDIEADVFAAFLATVITSAADVYSNRRLGHVFLSQRQREVLSLLAEGHQTGRIAEKLCISEATVSKHFSEARLRLGASTREEALAVALLRELIEL